MSSDEISLRLSAQVTRRFVAAALGHERPAAGLELLDAVLEHAHRGERIASLGRRREMRFLGAESFGLFWEIHETGGAIWGLGPREEALRAARELSIKAPSTPGGRIDDPSTPPKCAWTIINPRVFEDVNGRGVPPAATAWALTHVGGRSLPPRGRPEKDLEVITVDTGPSAIIGRRLEQDLNAFFVLAHGLLPADDAIERAAKASRVIDALLGGLDAR